MPGFRVDLASRTAPSSADLAPRVGMALTRARAARRWLERALVEYELAFPKLRDPRVEHAAFPPMIGLYWDLVEANGGLPPRQATFGTAVSAQLPELPARPVVARACRAYSAYVRQHHFELVLRERFPLVLRGHALDVVGLDFLIIQGGGAYGLALSVETTAARGWARRKERRHDPMSAVPVLDLYVEPDRYIVGQFWLHHPDQAEEVQAFIESHAHQPRLFTGSTLRQDATSGAWAPRLPRPGTPTRKGR